MIPFRKTIAFRLFLLTFILLAIPLLVDTFIIFKRDYTNTLRISENHLFEVAAIRADILSPLLQPHRDLIPLLEYTQKLTQKFAQSKDRTQLQGRFKEIAEAGSLAQAALLQRSKEGKIAVIAANFDPNLSPMLSFDDDFFSLLMNLREEGTFEFLYRSNTGRYFTVFGTTIPGDGGVANFLILSRDVTETLDEALASGNVFATEYALLDEHFNILAATDSAMLDHTFSSQKENGKAKIPVTFANTYPLFSFNWQGKNQLGVIKNVSLTSYFLVGFTEQQALYWAPLKEMINDFAFYLATLLLGGSITYFLIRWISRPLQRLSEVMLQIQKGDTHVRYQEQSAGFEINELGQGFNQMIDTLLLKKHQAQDERVKAEIYNKELVIGQQVQRHLFPEKMPLYDNIDVVARYLPAKQVGGDFFDVFIRKNESDEELVIVIADAAGKGVSPCFFSLGVRSYLRVLAREKQAIGEIMEGVNRLFCVDTSVTAMFVTALLAIYNKKNNRLELFSAGHTYPYVVRSNGQIESVEMHCMALGVDTKLQSSSAQKQITLAVGDIVLFYTDGITDAQNEKGEFFGEERLKIVLLQERGQSSQVIADRLIENIKQFIGTTAQYDDITLVVIKVGQ